MFPTVERVCAFEKPVIALMKELSSAKNFLVVFCLIAFLLELVSNARRLKRPIQLYLLSHWGPARMELTDVVPVTLILKLVSWWLQDQNIMRGSP